MNKLAKLAVLGIVVSGAFMQVANAGVIFGESMAPVVPTQPVITSPVVVPVPSSAPNVVFGEPLVQSAPAPVINTNAPMHIVIGEPIVRAAPVPSVPVKTPVHVILGEPLSSTTPTPVVINNSPMHIEF
jgi:hypothetical protein